VVGGSGACQAVGQAVHRCLALSHMMLWSMGVRVQRVVHAHAGASRLPDSTDVYAMMTVMVITGQAAEHQGATFLSACFRIRLLMAMPAVFPFGALGMLAIRAAVPATNGTAAEVPLMRA
jgi:hypothetical protein